MKVESLNYMFSSYHSNIELLPIPEVGIYERIQESKKKKIKENTPSTKKTTKKKSFFN